MSRKSPIRIPSQPSMSSVRDLSKRWGRSESTVYGWISAGRLKHVKRGGRVFVTDQERDEFAETYQLPRPEGVDP